MLIQTSNLENFIFTYIGPALMILLTGLAGWMVKRLGDVHKAVNSNLDAQKVLVLALTKDNVALRTELAVAGIVSDTVQPEAETSETLTPRGLR